MKKWAVPEAKHSKNKDSYKLYKPYKTKKSATIYFVTTWLSICGPTCCGPTWAWTKDSLPNIDTVSLVLNYSNIL